MLLRMSHLCVCIRHSLCRWVCSRILLKGMMGCHMHYSLVIKIRHLPYGPSIKYPFAGARAKFIVYDQQILLTRGTGWGGERENLKREQLQRGWLSVAHWNRTAKQVAHVGVLHFAASWFIVSPQDSKTSCLTNFMINLNIYPTDWCNLNCIHWVSLSSSLGLSGGWRIPEEKGQGKVCHISGYWLGPCSWR